MRLSLPVAGLCSLLLYLLPAITFAAPHQQRGYQSSLASTVFQLEQNGTWFENLAAQRNGSLLATRMDVPELWSINPSKNISRKSCGSVLFRFPNATSVLGITEIDKDVFAVIAGNVSLPSVTPTPGSFVIWTIDLTSAEPKAKILAPMPAGQFLDGMSKFNDNLLLISDTAKGVVWRLDITTGNYSEALRDPIMLPAAGQPIAVGVNGINVLGDNVYFTSTTQEVFARVQVDENAAAVGPIQQLVSGFTFDGFALAEDGTAYLSTNPQNELIKVTPEGRVHMVAGGQFRITIGGSTAVTTNNDLSLLYVTTSGAQFAPILGETTEPAKVVAIRL
ncbi:hypothetical protein N7499_000372 [Penicillium canescens]|uniref:SMP-30/Gluconolactonase/LRE-like region domain-containing protein n=1 Tax=Penicillium canescens TaxID=5083 RepID=A0AAD6NB41_PENCN|nr:uncharacterized protein N7446_011430 [Penicillium canescens]KAJ6004302.1 hypothetical protein N7522_005947 [Penicillium canescens]KAJ6029226.1 hypothetical protein N7444_012213 [Penicillium canescens]KAJ6047657.1 hypothetical protein N7460_003804 [Penicillium canescens]KAJ6048747.1 hypothetical protein N7446_011430 [Penicillium canescens]KAJ6100742.1 hypothetical protein N7499_000372 [Penicillium canescens]